HGLADRPQVIGESNERARGRTATAAVDAANRWTTLLLCGLSDGRRVAVPLSVVARLEVFQTKSIERLANELVVQYRGDVLPLMDIEGLLEGGGAGSGLSRAGENGTIQVLVHDIGTRSLGLVV